MKQTQNKLNARSFLLRLFGITLCIVPVAMSIFCYFPAWRAAGGEVLLSGTTLLLLCLAAIPLYKLITEHLRSPAAYTVWLIAFILFALLSNIAHEMVIISFTGFIGNLLGAVMFKLAGGKNERA